MVETNVAGRGRHIAGIDLVRFWAALLVMTYHLGHHISAVGHEGYRMVDGAFRFPELAFTQFGWVGVPIFFVVSGLVISNSAEASSTGGFFRSRVVRLMPTLWLCATLTFLVLLFRSQADLADYVRTMLILPYGPWVDGVYWSLTVEIVFYALVFFQMAFAPGRLPWLLAGIGLVSTAFWVTAWAGAPLAVWLTDTRHAQMLLLEHGCYFAFGGYVWFCASRGLTPGRLALTALFFAGGLLNFLYTGGYIPAAIWTVSVAAILASLRWSPPAGWLGALRTVGLITYPLYLLHNVVGAFLMHLLEDFGRWGALGGGVVGVLLLSYLVVRIEPVIQAPVRNAITTLLDLPPARHPASG